MSLTIKAGARLKSAVCSTELIVVKAPAGAVDITIGGVAPAEADRPVDGSPADGHGGGTAMGKRYVDAADTIELLCTKPGEGVPAIDGEILHLKDAKPLPASD